MLDDDKLAFSKLLDGLELIYDKALTVELKRLYWGALAGMEWAQLERSVAAHVADKERGRWFPKPADLWFQWERMQQRDARPLADEAWAVAVQARLDDPTVVWTRETAQAWAVASAVLELGDEVGARMAFKAAYERLVAEARRNGGPVQWEVSLGFDARLRQEALAQAVTRGQVSPERARQLAPPEEVNQEVQQVVSGLLSGKVVAFPTASASENARRFAAAVRDGMRQAEQAQAERERQQERAAEQAREAEAKARVRDACGL